MAAIAAVFIIAAVFGGQQAQMQGPGGQATGPPVTVIRDALE